MCGIAGVLGSADGDVGVVERMGAALRHRGPDALGTWSDRKRLSVVHTRLSIVDLTDAGNQPFVENGDVLVFNGEIYNHLSLRPELTQLGTTFRGTSDTATLFAALRRWGVEKSLRRIRGMFAFAYYEKRTETLFLCRDRLGIKPLHYLERGDSLFFASEVKAIQVATRVSIDPLRAVFAMSSVADDSLDRTAFRGVHQVPPGGYLSCGPDGATEVHRYYDPVEDLDEAMYRELDAMPESAIVTQFRELLDRSVSAMLMADARLGAFVSGGIDSSLIAALGHLHSKDLPLFTSNVVGPYSEVADARRLASSLGLPLHESAFDIPDFVESWAHSTWHYEYPIVRHVNAVPFSRVAGLARQTGVKAVFTGEGADELFLGYPKLLTRRFDAVARGPVDALMSLYGRLPGLREHLWPTTVAQPDGFINLLVQDYQRQRLRDAAAPRLEFLGPKGAAEHYLTLQMLQESLHSLLHRNDRMGMSASIEARFPFLDEDVVRFGINLPVKFKIHLAKRFHNYKHPFLEDKWVVRKMASDLLPTELVTKRKNGFPSAGYKALHVSAKFFDGGFVEDVLSLSRATTKYIAETVQETQPVFVGRLAAVELFGRLFDGGWSVDQTTAHVRKHVTIRA